MSSRQALETLSRAAFKRRSRRLLSRQSSSRYTSRAKAFCPPSSPRIARSLLCFDAQRCQHQSTQPTVFTRENFNYLFDLFLGSLVSGRGARRHPERRVCAVSRQGLQRHVSACDRPRGRHFDGQCVCLFGSKLEILFTLYAPWLQQRLDQLDRSLARTRSRQARLEKLLLTLWRDIPRDDNGFSSNLIQALASTAREDYNPLLRELFQNRVSSWVSEFLQLPAKDAEQMAGILLMAFDGFVINVRLAHGVAFSEESAKSLAKLLLSSRDDKLS